MATFRGQLWFLSNFAPCNLVVDGRAFRTLEHAFAAAKTFDEGWKDRIAAIPTAAGAKRLGRSAPLHADWEKKKLRVMEDLLRQKFSIPHFADQLLATGEKPLVEENEWGDRFWGVCRGQGLNHLGRLLMKIRDELRS